MAMYFKKLDTNDTIEINIGNYSLYIENIKNN